MGRKIYQMIFTKIVEQWPWNYISDLKTFHSHHKLKLPRPRGQKSCQNKYFQGFRKLTIHCRALTQTPAPCIPMQCSLTAPGVTYLCPGLSLATALIVTGYKLLLCQTGANSAVSIVSLGGYLDFKECLQEPWGTSREMPQSYSCQGEIPRW
jgi:hypothetical protein